jgi:Sulfotransferase family
VKTSLHDLKRVGSAAKRRVRMEVYGRVGQIPSPEGWLFIAGCPNSGTTLLKTLLGSHPSIATMSVEGHAAQDQLVTADTLGMPRLYALRPDVFRMTEDSGSVIDVDRIKRQWGSRFNDLTRPILLDDSPPNATRTRWLQKHFQPASFLFLNRNGYAVAEGIRRRTGHALELATLQWSLSNRVMLDDEPYLERVHTIRYEDLAACPDETCREVLRFLGLDAERFTVSDAAWTVHRETGPIRDMNASSLARLTDEDRDTIERIAGPMLRRLGYAPEPVASSSRWDGPRS